MPMRQKWAVLLWLLGATVAVAVSTMWVVAAQDGKMSAWAFVSLAWSVALLAGLAHQVRPLDSLTRYRQDHTPLAGPAPGARLPQ